MRANHHAPGSMATSTQLEALKQDSTKLQSENAELHVLLIKANESRNKDDKDAYQHHKRLEDRVAELSYWKSTATERMQAAERENLALRAKVDELLKLTDQLTSGGAC